MLPRNEQESNLQSEVLDNKVTGRGLVIALLNINSLLAHIDELRIFMSGSKIDILAINETKLDSDINDNEIELSGFEIVRNDRSTNGRSGGGVCIYLRNNLNYQIRSDLYDDQLECLTVEITQPRSKSFLVSTWYRPPSSPANTFHAFENLIDKIDAEAKELYLLGDLNVDILTTNISHNQLTLTSLLDIYGLSQMISDPTRVTPASRTLIDLCLTNAPEKIANSGVLHLGISDHSLVYMTRKMRYERSDARVIETRQFKNFNKTNFLHDLAQQPWEIVNDQMDPDGMWVVWKDLLMETIDKHAPLKRKQVSKKNSPWISNELLGKIHKRDYLKKKAITRNDTETWQQYKQARNETNNAIRLAKKKYFTNNF